MTATIEQFLVAKRQNHPHTGSGRSPRTLATYRERLLTAERLLGHPIAESEPGAERRLLAEMERVNLAPSSRNLTLSAVRAFFIWAVGNGLLSGNPFEHVRAFKVDSSLPFTLDEDTIEQLLTAIARQSRRYGVFFRVMYSGALRIGEVRTLRRRDVRADHVIVRGKGSKQRYVPLQPAVMAELQAYTVRKPGQEYVFEGRGPEGVGRPVTPRHATELFKETVAALGIDERATPHKLRASAATRFHARIGDLALTQDFLGHASPTVTRRYVRTSPERLKAAYQASFA